MSFLHPLILSAGLLAIVIPIIIHFLRRRRRPIEWAAMRFLQDALRKRRRRLRLEQLLLLLTRCAIVALLAVAIARPTSGGDVSSQPTAHIIAIDNSIASATNSDGTADLSRAIDAALAVVERASRSTGDTVAVLTLGAPGGLELWPPTADTDAARRVLDRVTPTDSRASLDALRDALRQRPGTPDETGTTPVRTVLHVVSGWRNAEGLGLNPDAADRSPIAGVDAIELHTASGGPATIANVGIDTIGVTTPTVVGSATLAPQTRVFGTLVRSGVAPEQAIEIELIARPTGTIAGRTVARFEPGQTSLNWSVGVNDAALTPGRGGRIALGATLKIDDANPRDNHAAAVLSRKRELRAAVVERSPVGLGTRGSDAGITPGTWAMAALTPDERAGVESFRVDPASLGSIPAGSIDALFILEPARLTEAGWARASELLALGGLVVITPDASTGAGSNLADWDGALRVLSDNQITINRNAGVRSEPERLARTAPVGLLSALQGEFADLIASVGVRQRVDLIVGAGAIVPVATEPGQGGPGAPFIAQTSARGTLVVFAAPFDVAWSDLPARPVFVPILQELVRRGSGLGVDNALTAGIPPGTFDPGGAIDRWTLDASMSPDSDQTGTPGARAGVWLGLSTDGRVVRTLAVRPDATGAVLETPTPEDRLAAIGELFPGVSISDDAPSDAEGAQVRNASAWGDRLALLLLVMCAGLAVFEALLARVASHPAGAAA